MNFKQNTIQSIIFTLILLLITALSTNFNTQNIRYKTYGTIDGMLSNDIYRVEQDSQGYIWILSEKGIMKFNGYTFQNYTVKDGLPVNDVWEMHEDQNQCLWLSMFTYGLYYIKNDKIHKVKNTDNYHSIMYLSSTKDTSFFYSKAAENFYYDHKNKQFGLYEFEPNKQQIKSSKNQKHYCRSTGSLYEIYENHQLIDTFRLKENQFLGKNDVSFISSHDGVGNVINKIYIFEENGVKIIDPSTLCPSFSIFKPLYPNNGYWYVCNNEVYAITDFDKKTRNLKLEKILSEFLEDGNSYFNIYIDAESNIWISKVRKKITFISNKILSEPIELYHPQKLHVKNFIVHKENLIFSTYNNELYNYNFNSQSLNLIASLDKEIKDFKVLNDFLYVLSYNFVYTYDLLLKRALNKHSINQNDEYIVSRIAIKEPTKIVTNNLTTIEIENNAIKKILKPTEPTNSLRYITLKFNKDKLLRASNMSVEYRDSSSTSILFTKQVKDVYDAEFIGENIILGTNGHGLMYVTSDGKTKDTKFLGVCFNDLHIKNDTLFAGSNMGLLILKIDTINQTLNPIQFVNLSDGLASNDINKIDIYKNNLILLTSEGFERIPFERLFTKNEEIPNLIFTKIKINSNEIDFNNNTTFNHNASNFNFEYVALSYYSFKDITYEYILEGYDTTRQYTKELTISYTNLPSGTYTLRIKATNSHGIQSKEIAYNFSILPHFTNTLWFRFILFILGGAFITIIIYSLQKRKERIFNLKQKFAQLELKALQAQMNPHFIFNSLSAIQSVMFENDELKANRYMGIFAKLIRKTLDNSKYENITLKDEIEYLSLYLELEKFRLDGNLYFKIEIDDELEHSKVTIPAMIFQPIVENAIIHGLQKVATNKSIIIRFVIENNNLCGIVMDNGVGILNSHKQKAEKNKEFRSWASTILAERIKTLNYLKSHNITFKIEYADQEKKYGTKITVNLPLSNKSKKIKYRID